MDTLDQNLAKTVHQTRNGHSTEALPRPMAPTGSSIPTMAHYLQPAWSDHYNNYSRTADSQLPQVQQYKVPSVLLDSTSSATTGDPHQLPSNNWTTITRFSSSSTNLPPYPIKSPEIPSPNLITNIRRSLPTYAPKLWSKLVPNPPDVLTHLTEHLSQNKGKLLIVSYASLNAQHRSAFSWTIATASTELWNGARTSPSTQHDTHSRQSEGYGILAAFTFIKKYIQVLNTQLPLDPPTIHGYCDNSGLIQLVMALQSINIPNPSRTIANDYDLSNEIHQTILRIPFPVQLHHIKGHQDDKTKIKDLPYEAQLNIACARATIWQISHLIWNLIRFYHQPTRISASITIP